MSEISTQAMASRAIERNVIACMLNKVECLEAVHLPIAAFETEQLRISYSMVQELLASGNVEVSVATLRTFYDQREDFAELLAAHGGYAFLENLAAKPDFANFKVHLDELTRRHDIRAAKARAAEALDKVQSAEVSEPGQIYDLVDSHLNSTGAVLRDNEYMHSGDYSDDWLEKQTTRYLAGEFASSGIPVLNDSLRHVMGDSLIHGSMLILAGETNIGKSQWLQMMVRHFTYQQGIPTLVFDNELSKCEFQNRTLANVSGVRLKKLFNGQAFDPHDMDYPDVKHGVKAMGGMPLVWRKMLDMKIERVEAVLRRFLRQYPKEQYPHKLIIIDGLKMQSGNDNFVEVGFFAQNLKGLAQKYEDEGVVFTPTCQLNRTGTAKNVAKEKDIHPDHNNIGLSKLIADNADDVYLVLKHPELDGQGQKIFSKHHRRLICTKARNHSTFDGQNYILMDFDGSRSYMEPQQAVGPDIERQMPSVSSAAAAPNW